MGQESHICLRYHKANVCIINIGTCGDDDYFVIIILILYIYIFLF